ncbi:hypothetical protein HYW74_04705 [Candidatus Pacearchaeota archaeon]|nr:hypothetical protein [Candidatus Pacearchaeota archaeon]
MVEYDVEINSLDELNHYFEIVETFFGQVNAHSLKLKLPYEDVNHIGDNFKPLKNYFKRARDLGYSIKAEQIGEPIGDPFIITHVTFSHPGLAELLERDREAA